MDKRIKIKVSKRTRTGNNKLCGLLVATIDSSSSRKQFEETSTVLKEAVESAVVGKKIVSLIVPDNMKVNFIRIS